MCGIHLTKEQRTTVVFTESLEHVACCIEAAASRILYT